MYTNLFVKSPLFLSDVKKGTNVLDSEKSLRIKFNKNSPSGSRFVPCRRTDEQRD